MFSKIFSVNGKRKKKVVKTKGYVQLGTDDFPYFDELDQAYIESPTATMSILKFLEYCVPLALLQEFQKLWKKVSSDYIRYGYYVIQVSYDIDGNPVRWDYLSPRYIAPKDQDDNGNVSTYINRQSGKIYPAFNSNKEVVKAQFEKEGFLKFSGQIYMYNDTSMPFRITPLYSVLKWMRTEADSSTYVDKACDNAMFGNNIFVVKKSSSASDREIEILNNLKQSLSESKGVAEAAQNLMLEYEGDTDDVTKLISKVSISNEIDIDKLSAADTKAEEKICMACYGFPLILVKQNEGVFGNSGEALTVATEQWAKTCLKEADNILDGFKEIGFNILKTTKDVEDTNPGGA